MTATDLYNDLVLHGFSLSVQGGNLILSPSSQLSQSQRLEIKQHKSELLSLLAANDPTQPKHTVTDSPLTTNELLRHYEKPLFNHLLACPYCHVEKAQYCLNGYAMGSVYDALLLYRDDAQTKRANLALRVDRAKIKGDFR